MFKRGLSFALGTFCLAATAGADPKQFTFNYDTYPIGKGEFEYEQWVTYKGHKDVEPGYDKWQFRHELEIGLADNVDLGIYFANWSYEDSDSNSGAEYDNFALEGIVYLLNPATDPIGLGLYSEIKIGEHELVFEPKLLLQKDIGNWTFVYNLVLETELEGVFSSREETEMEGILGHRFGISYGLTPSWFVGAEAIIDSVYADWSDYEKTTVYAGPAVAYHSGKNWWVAVTPTMQLTDEENEPDFVVRMIAAWEF